MNTPCQRSPACATSGCLPVSQRRTPAPPRLHSPPLHPCHHAAIDPVATLAVFRSVGVPPLLYNLVFGESVINDAATIILFEVTQ